MKKLQIIYHYFDSEVEAIFTFLRASAWQGKEVVIGTNILVQYTIHVPGLPPIVFNRAFPYGGKGREDFERKLKKILLTEEDVYVYTASYSVREFIMS